MLYIPKPPVANIEKYYDSIKLRIESAKNGSTLRQEAKDFLTTSKIKEIVCDEPVNLLKHHKAIIPLLGASFSLSDYNKYCKIKKMRPIDRSIQQVTLYDLYNPEIEKLSSIFDYNKFISGHKITSYNLASILNRNTCTYCNRLYSIVIVVKDEVTGRVNDSTRLTRPQFDHWYSKSKYCVLALSFYNLIPSCSVCNSSIKGDADFSLNKHVHPYLELKNQKFSFNYIQKDVHKNNVDIKVNRRSKIANTLKEFKIKEVYNAHSEFELKDLLELKYKYSENYINTLFNNTFKLDVGKDEAYRLIFGAEPNENDFHKRPFSKFKRDILNELLKRK